MPPLTEKYRPSSLDDILGQSEIVESLQALVAEPYSTAFLFTGPTGCGKTSAAVALAHGLGVCIDQADLGGLWQIASGEQTGDTVRAAIDHLRCRPWCGSGWRVLVVNECDRISEAAAFVWLDTLESLPDRSVVIFTTNCADRIPWRLRDRCEVFEFKSADDSSMHQLVARVWKAETGRDDAPAPAMLGLLADDNGDASFRRVLQLLSPAIRAGGILPNPVKLATPQDQSTALWWIAGGALALAVGDLALVAAIVGAEPEQQGAKMWTPDDMLR